MITEDYVSFETAKLLKEKGFDEVCIGFYTPQKELHFSFLGETNSTWLDNSISAPTFQIAMKWLREEKKLSIIIEICFDDDRDRVPGYYFEIWQLTTPYESPDTPVLVFDTYEDACEAAIKYCLENLI